MQDSLAQLPLSFWAVIGVALAGGGLAITRIKDGIGLPMLVVLLTVVFWYPGDAIYNDYADYHVKMFAANVLTHAWWQVAWFLLAFSFLTMTVHRLWNGQILHRGSGTLRLFRNGVDDPEFQRQIGKLFKACLGAWLVLIVLASIRLGADVRFFLFPFLGHKIEAFGRPRIGSGIDFIYAMLNYFNQLASAGFGIVAATSRKSRTRLLAILFCILSWMPFLLDRTRNSMLVVVMPGILAWGFLGVRGNILKKAAVLSVCFLAINAWMKFIISTRSHSDIATALMHEGAKKGDGEETRHEGLNMYEELCWINTFLEDGSYRCNWGERYFAEFVNFIPRSLWHGKPEIGIDYAIARGGGGGAEYQAGVYTTFSTGMVGQGVVNFGPILGPLAAALIMSAWCVLLARTDLNSFIPGNTPLFGLGLILTFNMGRDISLIILYPFIFGFIVIKWLNRRGTARPGNLPGPREAVPASASARKENRHGIKPIRRRPLTRKAVFSPGNVGNS